MKCKAILLSCLTALFLSFACIGAADENNNETRIRTIPHKNYFKLTSRQINRLAEERREVGVKLEGRFNSTESPPARNVRVQDVSYNIARAVRLAGNLVCLVPEDHIDSLALADELERDQEVTVYGIILGRRGGDTYIVSERIIDPGAAEGVQRPQAGYELTLESSQRDSLLVNSSGEHTFEFECRNQRGETEKLRVLVTEVTRQEFDRRMEQLSAEDDAEEVEADEQPEVQVEIERTYSRYEPVAVYRAIGEDRSINAVFSDSVRSVLTRDYPSRIRDEKLGEMRIGGAFETRTGPILCLIPENNPAALERLDYLLTDMAVSVKGVTLRAMRGERLFLVDELSIPGLIEPPETDNVWIVTLALGDEITRFFELGEYRLTFPCTHEEDAAEPVRAELRKVQIIEMDVE